MISTAIESYAVDEGFPGCAGTHPVFAHPDADVDPTDPATAGGDPFDLHDIGVDRAAFVRVCDAGVRFYGGDTGGFDLDGVAVIHAAELP